MAASLTGLKDIIECALCLETCAEPVALPCLHTYCKTCLASHINKAEKSTFACPLCQAEYKCPHDGVDAYNSHFLVNKIADILRDLETSEPKKCPLHTDRNVVYFCYDCQVEICIKCVTIKNHKGHNFDILDDVRDKAKVELKGLFEKLQVQEQNAVTYYKNIDDEITQGVETFLKVLQLRANEAIAYVKKWLEETTNQVKILERKLKMEHRKSYDEIKNDFDTKTGKLHSISNSDDLKWMEGATQELTKLSEELERFCSKVSRMPTLRMTDKCFDLGKITEVGQHQQTPQHGTVQVTRPVAIDTCDSSHLTSSTTQPTVEVCAVAAPVAMGRYQPIAAGSGFVLGGDVQLRLCLYAATESGITRLWGDRPLPAQIWGSYISAAVTATELYLHSSDGLTHVYSHELQHRPRDLPPYTGELKAVLSDGSHAVLGRGVVTIAGRESLTLPENCRDCDGVSVAAECRETGRWTAVAYRHPHTLILYDAQGSRQFTESLSFQPAPFNAVAVLPGDRLLVAARHPPAVHIYSASGGLTHEREWTSTQLGVDARDYLRCLTVSGNRLLLATGSDEFTLHRYRITH